MPVVVAGSITVLLLVVAVVLEGARPQVVALVGGAALTAVIVMWLRSLRAPKLAVTGASLFGIGVVGIAGAAWLLPPVLVPSPSGPDAVGVTAHVWTDTSRDAHGGGGPGERRSLPVTVWYPAARHGAPAQYLPEEAPAAELTTALADQYGVPPVLFDSLLRAKSTATWNGDAAAGSSPVVIASPGFASTRWFFTSWAEELASNGVIVIAVDHPYDAIATELVDGSIATDEATSTGDDAADQAAADRAIGVRAADVRAVIDHLEADSSRTPDLAAADLTRIIAAGHSAGGATAIEAARIDDRIMGVVDIDGMPRSPGGTALVQPILAIVAGDMDPNPEYDQALNGLLAGGVGARLTLDGVAHLGMMDVGRLIAPIPGVTGSNGGDGARLAARATFVLITAVDTRTPIDVRVLGALGRVEDSVRGG
ncbi:alpha/beta hydrolase family protein [Plantibacter sp. YIM 135249]|uniref:alpha/beta hydrolase family protein n=1 Tax=Plantibacter sp. YIM 135249 TaxID=3423918 RepID=UPI003D330A7F